MIVVANAKEAYIAYETAVTVVHRKQQVECANQHHRLWPERSAGEGKGTWLLAPRQLVRAS